MPIRITIIGGGLTGAVAAIQLLRAVRPPFELVIVEPHAELGRGLAYGKAEAYHLLNVRAAKLGVVHGEPNDFAAWVRNRSTAIRGRPDRTEPGRAFLSRRLFGTYVGERLAEAIAERPDVKVVHHRSLATMVRRRPNGFDVSFDNRPAHTAQFLILATGYGHTWSPTALGRSPFAELDPKQVRAAKSALFVGTGLTFVDAFARLRSHGFRGAALAISRRGLLPEVHRANETPASVKLTDDPSLSELLLAFRTAMKASESPPAAAVDLILGMREGVQGLWRSLGIRQQRQFLGHLRPYWNAARHRVAPEIHAQLRRAMQTGALRVARGDIVEVGGEPCARLSGRTEGPFDLTFDCTGFRPDISSALVRSLVAQDLARIDPHGLGLMVDLDGGVQSGGSSHSLRLFALGPLGHGSLYEITAVAEIVSQSASMAQAIRAEMQDLSLQPGFREPHGLRSRTG